uniref:Uncharacterized protein n=1 Tax=Nothoprocta perdicaria TaxID=30464 RepID=A0A8C6ZJ30_NOTPE
MAAPSRVVPVLFGQAVALPGAHGAASTRPQGKPPACLNQRGKCPEDLQQSCPGCTGLPGKCWFWGASCGNVLVAGARERLLARGQ